MNRDFVALTYNSGILLLLLVEHACMNAMQLMEEAYMKDHECHVTDGTSLYER